MFRLAAFTTLVLAAFAVANPTHPYAKRATCSSGTLQCCDSIQPSNQFSADELTGLLPIGVSNLGVPIGVNCNPISVIGIGSGANCNSQPVCCSSTNSGSGLLSGVAGVGCVPANVQAI